MPERSPALPDPSDRRARSADVPPPEVADFILFCYRRRQVGWPELYDEMCAVAAHRAYRGWGTDELGERGLSFSLLETQRLSQWVRAVILPRAASGSGGVPGIVATRAGG